MFYATNTATSAKVSVLVQTLEFFSEFRWHYW